MIILGILVVLAAAAFGADLVVSNTYHVLGPSVFGHSLGLTNMAAIFMVGVITGAGIVLGVALIFWGVRHRGVQATRRHRERRQARAVRSERDSLAAENARIRSESVAVEGNGLVERRAAVKAPVEQTGPVEETRPVERRANGEPHIPGDQGAVAERGIEDPYQPPTQGRVSDSSETR